jgi:predicted metal-dependent hydrolase
MRADRPPLIVQMISREKAGSPPRRSGGTCCCRERLVPYTVQYRPRRKYLAVAVHPDLRVEVLVPERTSSAAIDHLLIEKEDWIARTLARLEAVPVRTLSRTYREGETFLFLGEQFRLCVSRGTGPSSVTVADGQLSVQVDMPADPSAVRSAVIGWYRDRAAASVLPLVTRYAAVTGGEVQEVRFKLLQRRWGSCSSKGNLNFNIRLVMAPPSQIEYIVVHELCHLGCMDHSPRFWRRVGEVLPGYRRERQHLKEQGWEYLL